MYFVPGRTRREPSAPTTHLDLLAYVVDGFSDYLLKRSIEIPQKLIKKVI